MLVFCFDLFSEIVSPPQMSEEDKFERAIEESLKSQDVVVDLDSSLDSEGTPEAAHLGASDDAAEPRGAVRVLTKLRNPPHFDTIEGGRSTGIRCHTLLCQVYVLCSALPVVQTLRNLLRRQKRFVFVEPEKGFCFEP